MCKIRVFVFFLFDGVGFLGLLVELLDLFHFVVAAHEDTSTVVDVLRLNLEHSLHVAVNGLAASCDSQLAFNVLCLYWN